MSGPADKPFRRVDPSSPIPYYVQICEFLRSRIKSGEWPRGAQIPTEAELCKAYDVSRITIRQAVALLERDGLLVRGRGRGTFVREPSLTAAPRSVSSFSTELRDLGMKAGSRILETGTVAAAPEMAAEMDLEVGSELISLRRLRTADDRVIGVQDTLLVASRFAGLLDVLHDGTSLYEVMQDYYGVLATGATEVFGVTGVKREDAKLLDCKVGQPAFEVTRVTFDDHGVFERTHSVLHGDRYQIKIALQNARRTKGMQ
ncbi:GntR family transcriptional regulator [Jatrophihabitans lederbergiae]|uniref:GntR family transcriptional regulator n=1 Tax=Jatrophihabitans lederbergiae TaxID=3075547 RepID=A0ABU2JFI6_9ACTN|nr:GntR family transcriptional regulator [Jatrophihabitans sp. DSM 44399]MDT0263741.1 GntR family transcriptional regulator [Jatrophihabitans sp. DSM 44399]